MAKYPVARTILIVAVLSFVIAEICLRQIWGLGNMLLFDSDPSYEYISKPNQDTKRFGNRVISNEFSMRSLPLTDQDSCIVLGFGDSVINGGALTDQDSLATTIVEQKLQQEKSKAFRFLNISAGSWAPDNCAAYLTKHGAFNAKMIVLFVSSHDARDNMTFEPVVGVHQSYPDKQYPLASIELFDRYLWPRISGLMQRQQPTNDTLLISKEGDEFNPGFQKFKDYTEKNGIPFVICLHVDRMEAEQKKFNAQGDEILAFCAANNIKVISGLQIGEDVGDFRDDIHLNERGQRRWSEVLVKEIKETLTTCM
jgi:hypothetical protein